MASPWNQSSQKACRCLHHVHLISTIFCKQLNDPMWQFSSITFPFLIIELYSYLYVTVIFMAHANIVQHFLVFNMANLVFLSFPIGNSMKNQVFAIFLAMDNRICKVLIYFSSGQQQLKSRFKEQRYHHSRVLESMQFHFHYK